LRPFENCGDVKAYGTRHVFRRIAIGVEFLFRSQTLTIGETCRDDVAVGEMPALMEESESKELWIPGSDWWID
jgi:hypothetical protein